MKKQLNGYIIIIAIIFLLLGFMTHSGEKRNEFLGVITNVDVLEGTRDNGRLRIEIYDIILFVDISTEIVSGTSIANLYCVGNNLYRQDNGSLTGQAFESTESCLFILCKLVMFIFLFIFSIRVMMYYNIGTGFDSGGYPAC